VRWTRPEPQLESGANGCWILCRTLYPCWDEPKSYLAARFIHDLIHPASRHYVGDGLEIPMMAASQKQARVLWNYLCRWLDDGVTFKSTRSTNNYGIRNTQTGTGSHIYSSNAKTSFGLQGVPWVVADEPGAWEVAGGQMMQDAIETSMGKLGSSLRVLYIGTRSPARSGWWIDLLEGGTSGRTFVHDIQGDRARWDNWHHIRKINPLMASHKEGREVLIDERNKARRDSRLKARFLSYRLNLPSSDESTVLLTVDDWDRIIARPVPDPEGRPIVGADLGAGRAWSAACAVWPNGRVEAVALCPGIPSIADQEKRDGVPAGAYQVLIENGSLIVAEGLRVPPVAALVDEVMHRWPDPEAIIADRFRAGELQDSSPVEVEPRVSRWSEASYDIRALRKWAADGPLSVHPAARPPVIESLCNSVVKTDDQGNCRLAKKGTNNQGRDDISAALLLAVGRLERGPHFAPLQVYRPDDGAFFSTA